MPDDAEAVPLDSIHPILFGDWQLGHGVCLPKSLQGSKHHHREFFLEFVPLRIGIPIFFRISVVRICRGNLEQNSCKLSVVYPF